MTYFAPKSIPDDDDEREAGVSHDALAELDDDFDDDTRDLLEEDDEDEDYESYDDRDDY